LDSHIPVPPAANDHFGATAIDASQDSQGAELENPLLVYSLSGQLDQLRARAVAAKPILGEVALAGQSTVWYAEPNTGKTLLALRLLADSIALERVDPNRTFYVNMDDSSEGLFQKGAIAEQYKFHMIAGGENDFQPQLLIGKMLYMAQKKCAKGCVILIDTLKKLVDLMQKTHCTEFGAVVRAFTQAGGTVIALAHTNKNKSATGKAVHGGTADIMQDFDCAYLMTASKGADASVVVKFENSKKRGDVALEVSYSYSDIKGVSYEDRFASVTVLGEEEAVQNKFVAQLLSDEKAIESLKAFISAGTTAKKELMEEVSRVTQLGRDRVGGVIDRYCGNDESKHFWSMTKGAHGVHTYKLLPKYDVF
jgi:hypothetical protein